MKIAFIGHFAPASNAYGQASSIAGNLVQRQILSEIRMLDAIEKVSCYVMEPQPAWPRGPLVVDRIIEEDIEYVGYLNLPLIKHLYFSCILFLRLVALRPKLCIQYNSYLFENIALILYRKFSIRSLLAVVIQDVHVSQRFSLLTKRGLRSIMESMSLFFATNFDIIVPISHEIAMDFGFSPEKCLIFKGGLTDLSAQLIKYHGGELENIAVFAGGLEKHNGIDRLVNQWLNSGIEYDLHIFGRGTLELCVKEAAQHSSRIFYHGFQPEAVVQQWVAKARWNFCLRYSDGLNQEYFFPSKFFNIACAPGVAVVNKFHDLPYSLITYVCVVDDDLLDLNVKIASSDSYLDPNCMDARREILMSQYSWKTCINNIVKKFHEINSEIK
jgi:glycosyltransferase involved in cell wall biosynthesis